MDNLHAAGRRIDISSLENAIWEEVGNTRKSSATLPLSIDSRQKIISMFELNIEQVRANSFAAREALNHYARAFVACSYDVSRLPCEINHGMTDLCADLYLQYPEFAIPLADAVAAVVTDTRWGDGIRKAASEIFEKLHIQGYTKASEVPGYLNFVSLLVERAPSASLISGLSYSEMIRGWYVVRDEARFPHEHSIREGKTIVIPHWKDKSTTFYLHKLDQSNDYYFVTAEASANTMLGYFEAFNRGHGAVCMSIKIFDQYDTHRGIGRSVLKWAAQWSNNVEHIALIYQAEPYHYGLMAAAERAGIFSSVEECTFQKDITRLSKHHVNYEGYRWKPVDLSYVKPTQVTGLPEKTFLRGVIAHE